MTTVLRFDNLQPNILTVCEEDQAEPAVSILSVPSKCAEQAEEFVRKVIWCFYHEAAYREYFKNNTTEILWIKYVCMIVGQNFEIHNPLCKYHWNTLTFRTKYINQKHSHL